MADHSETVDSERDGDTVEEKTEANFSSENPKSDTLRLLNAIKTQNFQLVSNILENSPKLIIDLEDDVGKTPLHHLCSLGRTTEISLCLRRKPAVNKTDKIGWTPLHYAAMKGHTEISQLLVDAGADANKPDSQKGRTPLHLAVWRNHQDIAEHLIHSGADTNVPDQDGKTVTDLCRNEFMKNRLDTAVLAKQNEDEASKQNEDDASKNEIGEITVETMEIPLDKPTPFPNLGLTVQPVVPEDTDKTQERKTCFTMSIRRTPADKVEDQFVLEETEDVCSDIFTLKTSRTSGPTNVDISLPIITAPNAGEELVLKTDKGEELILTNIKEENEKTTCIATVDVTSLDSFVIVSRPKLEKFSVGKGATNIKSTVDDRVELDIPKGTFDKPATITMEITEPPQKDELKKVMDQCADITSTTSFYSLDSGGITLSKPVSIKVPLPVTYSGEGRLLLFTMNEDPSKESPDCWKLMSEANNVKSGRIEFEAPSFSVKVAVETSSTIPDDMSQFGSSSSFGSIVSQVSRIFRKSRRREHAVTFVCMSRRVGTSNTFRTVLVCCKVEQKAANIAYWEGEGFENNDSVKLSNNESEVRARAKQRFKITNKGIDVTENEDELYLDFQPKLERSYKTLSMKLPAGENITTGHFEFLKITKKKDSGDGEDKNEEEVEKVASVEVTLLVFNPNMMDKLDGRSFLTYRRMLELQKGIFDVWWKVLILMDIPFKTIEKTLSDYSGSLEEKINGLWFDWKEKNRGDKSRGIPILMSALCRCGKRLVANDTQKQLRIWKNNPDNRIDSFYEWLITAYKFDLLVPTRYDSPMSDTFLAMLADRVKPSAEFAAALSVPAGSVRDVLANNRVYPSNGMKTMKILDHFRNGMNNQPAALHKLVDGLREMKLNADADYVIMMTGAWMKRQTGEERAFADVYEKLTK